ncbi:STN domain-containing protein [Pseudomonas sp. Milli4]|uniref:STN domain-containing protein n=1 Tax=Pseudomonas schmalbachii TaxID=2816993 RepID=A0ABS3TX35_9PSED|nr:STN domain-containing protein [Pseudomonas schmalbachii]
MTAPTLSLFRISALALALGCAMPVLSVAAERTYHFEQSSQPLDRALTDLTARTGLSIGADASLLAGKTAPALHGDYSAEQALERLLQGSGLEWRFSGERSITLRPAPPASTSAAEHSSASSGTTTTCACRPCAWRATTMRSRTATGARSRVTPPSTCSAPWRCRSASWRPACTT